jgi:hypothetical protein
MVQGGTAKEQATIGVPDFVSAIFTAGQDRVIHERPVKLQNNALVRLPLNTFLTCLNGLEMDLTVASEEQVFIVWLPQDRVNGVRHLRES